MTTDTEAATTTDEAPKEQPVEEKQEEPAKKKEEPQGWFGWLFGGGKKWLKMNSWGLLLLFNLIKEIYKLINDFYVYSSTSFFW